VDISTNIGFIRRRGNISIYYKSINGKSKYDIYNVEVEKKCPSEPFGALRSPNIFLKAQDPEFDNHFGTLDLETLTIDELGVQQTYAGGWYIGENSPVGKGGEIIIAKDSKDNVIKMLIDSIFKYMAPREGESKEKTKERNGLTFFAQNLGRFDGVEIIKGIIQEEDINSIYDDLWKGTWKTDEGRLLSLRIKHKKLNCHINLHDSLSFFNFTSLDKVMKSYKIGVSKGIFPHSWPLLKGDNLEYIGNKPDKKYYIDNVTLPLGKKNMT
jgi:DNA polymerase type B, organellar and viral